MINLKAFFTKKKTAFDFSDEINQYFYDTYSVKPKNKSIYIQSLTHKSISVDYNNERLEFLGDSILSTVVISFLYARFPNKTEGELTELTSKIVSRDSLNNLGKKLNIQSQVKYIKQKNGHKNILGNTLEAIIGAIYLDQGFETVKKVIVKSIIKKHIQLKILEKETKDPKSIILIWGQKTKNSVEFKGRVLHDSILYKSELFINGKLIATASKDSKKLAEREVSQQARDILFLKE